MCFLQNQNADVCWIAAQKGLCCVLLNLKLWKGIEIAQQRWEILGNDQLQVALTSMSHVRRNLHLYFFVLLHTLSN